MIKPTISEGKNFKPLTVRLPAWVSSIKAMAEKVNLKPDRAKAVLHQFFLAWYKNEVIRKNKKLNRLPEYFAVSSEILKEIGTRDYNRYVNLFIVEKIIERKASGTGGRCYLPGSHAQLYRWVLPIGSSCGPTFRKDKVEDYTTIKSILRTRDNHQKLKLSADVEIKHQPVFEKLKEILLDTVLVDDNRNDDYTLEELQWFVVDEFAGRFHHRVSSMPKEQRKLLRFKGHEQTPLVTIDFKNSQPYFSAMVSTQALIEAHLPEFTPIVAIAERERNKPDFQLYRQLCIEGRIYELFMEAFGISPHDKLERNKLKTQLFRAVFFSRKRVYGRDKQLQGYFKSVFPSVFSFFSAIKKMNESQLPELKEIIKPKDVKFKYAGSNASHRLLSCLLQRVEARFFYRIMIPNLLKAGINPLCIHDSIMILPGHAEQAVQIIRDSFESIGLVPPTLSVE